MLTKTFTILVVASAMITGALAAGNAPKPTLCPVCHMPLASKKSAANPVAVKLTKKSKVMYCCAGCKMPASVLVKGKK